MENYKKKHRLQDIIALIQVLSNCEKPNRSLKGLHAEMGSPPLSAPDWKKIIQEHPEFFRYNTASKFGISLLLRSQKHKQHPSSQGPLSLEEQEMLIRTATDLWERQQKEHAPSLVDSPGKGEDSPFLMWINDISRGKIEQTITTIQAYLLEKNDREHGKIMTTTSARWNSLKREKLKGSISEADAQLTENQLLNAIVELVYELKEHN